MKAWIPIICSLLIIGCQTIPQNKGLARSQKAHQLREQPATWDQKMLEEDVATAQFLQKEGLELGPMPFSAFPTPEYDSIQPFFGVGGHTFRENTTLGPIRSTLFHYKASAEDTTHRVFFQIIVADALPDSVEQAAQYVIISRNHPNYLGQGFIKMPTETVEFVAVTTTQQQAFAIINSRLFDLQFGTTILIKKHPKGYLMSKQVQIAELHTGNYLEKTQALLEEATIQQFLKGSD